MKVAVVGGTGTVGRHVVGQLQRDGHLPVVVSASRGVDTFTGAGLRGGLDGAQVLIDVSGAWRSGEDEIIEYFRTSTRNLVDEAMRVGVEHYLAISIVGIDRVPFPYYKGKLAQEEALLASGFPATIVRVTQFHELPGQLLGSESGERVLLRNNVCQPVAAEAAGTHLARLALGEPLGFAPELAGPRQEYFGEMGMRFVEQNRRLGLEPIRQIELYEPTDTEWGQAMLAGGLLPNGPVTVAGPTFDEWLLARERPVERPGMADQTGVVGASASASASSEAVGR